MRGWLKDIREKAGQTQTEVAEAAGISQNYYSAIETGNRGNPLNVNVAKRIAESLKFPWVWFYDDALGGGSSERERSVQRQP